MVLDRMYGLPSIDMGNWERKRDSYIARYIENSATGFKVYYFYPHIRWENGQRYIVQKDDFAMGFATPEEGLIIRHIDNVTAEPGTVIIGQVGGTYKADSSNENNCFVTLADETHFRSAEQQTEFLDVLKDAVPRIPCLPEYSLRWDGGLGYQVEFTDAVSAQISSGEFVQA